MSALRVYRKVSYGIVRYVRRSILRWKLTAPKNYPIRNLPPGHWQHSWNVTDAARNSKRSLSNCAAANGLRIAYLRLDQ